jgi:hypothetical protein
LHTFFTTNLLYLPKWGTLKIIRRRQIFFHDGTFPSSSPAMSLRLIWGGQRITTG